MPDNCPNCGKTAYPRGDDDTGNLRECTNGNCAVYLFEVTDLTEDFDGESDT